MITFTTLRTKLYAYIYAQSGNTTTIWADQDGPRPNHLYLVMRMETFLRVGQDYQGRPNGAGDNNITGNREFTLNIQAFGPGSFEVMELIRMSFNKPVILDTLRVDGIVYVDDMPIQNLSGIEDPKFTRFVERSSMDVIFRIAQEATDAPGFIGIVKDIEAKFYRGGELVQTEEFTVDTIT